MGTVSSVLTQASRASEYRFRYFDALVGVSPKPRIDAFASSRTRLRRGPMLRMTSWKKMVPQRNGIAATRRKGAYPLGRSRATRTTWEDTMSEIPSGSSAGRTNTLRQERIEVRRSPLALQMDHTAGDRSTAVQRSSVLGPALAPASVHLRHPSGRRRVLVLALPSIGAKSTQPGRRRPGWIVCILFVFNGTPHFLATLAMPIFCGKIDGKRTWTNRRPLANTRISDLSLL